MVDLNHGTGTEIIITLENGHGQHPHINNGSSGIFLPKSMILSHIVSLPGNYSCFAKIRHRSIALSRIQPSKEFLSRERQESTQMVPCWWDWKNATIPGWSQCINATQVLSINCPNLSMSFRWTWLISNMLLPSNSPQMGSSWCCQAYKTAKCESTSSLKPNLCLRLNTQCFVASLSVGLSLLKVNTSILSTKVFPQINTTTPFILSSISNVPHLNMQI